MPAKAETLRKRAKQAEGKEKGVKEDVQGRQADAGAAEKKPAPDRWRRWLPRFRFVYVLLALWLAFVWRVGSTMMTVISPLSALPPTAFENGLSPLWEDGQRVVVRAYVGTAAASCKASAKQKAPLIWESETSIEHNAAAVSKNFWLTAEGTQPPDWASDATAIKVPAKAMTMLQRRHKRDEGPVLTVCLLRHGRTDAVSSLVVNLTKDGFRPRHLDNRWLLQDVGLGWLSGVEPYAPPGTRPPYEGWETVPMWKPELTVHFIADRTPLPSIYVPLVHDNLPVVWADAQGKVVPEGQRPTQGRHKPHYLPRMFSSEMDITSDAYIVLNETVTGMPLQINVQPTQLTRWYVLNHYENGVIPLLTSQYGLSEASVDEVRQLIAGTSLAVLTATLVCSTLHLLFEFLAMKSDVAFWMQNKSLRGLSVTGLFGDFLIQTVILAHLWDEDSSLLIVGPLVAGLAIQGWKCWRATGVQFAVKGWRVQMRFTRLEREAKEQKVTGQSLDLDRRGMRAMGIVAAPLLVAFTVYSLVHHQHRSWYSWLLFSTASAVYTGGFILMTPQLFINYSLKSVAHLPWSVLCYRFTNTFIDDIFAFIIRMPMIHRLSCFRDDIVFIIYLSQRWLYRVDSSREESVDLF